MLAGEASNQWPPPPGAPPLEVTPARCAPPLKVASLTVIIYRLTPHSHFGPPYYKYYVS